MARPQCDTPPCFLFFWGLGAMESLFWGCSQCVPINFSKGSQQVLNMFPITPHFYPICFGQSWIFMEMNYKGGGFYASIEDCPMFPNWSILWSTNQSGFFRKKTQTKLWMHHSTNYIIRRMTIHHDGTLPFVSCVHKKKLTCKEELLENVVLCKKEATLRSCLMTLNWYQNICDDGVKWARPMWPQREKQWLQPLSLFNVIFWIASHMSLDQSSSQQLGF